MNVYLTFDVEIWCDGWHDLDGRFPNSFQRYVYGRSPKGNYALPKTLEILDRHALKGVFFVEPLFAARFGTEHLAELVDLIRVRGHEIQLHLHPEWTDELSPLPFAGANTKRQHLCCYTLEEQTVLLNMGRDLLARVGCEKVTAFRAGSFACNHDTYRALRQVGILIDSSLHEVLPESGIDLRNHLNFFHAQHFEQVSILPMTVFRDGTGRLRPAQVGACGYEELRDALSDACDGGTKHFVILSHNFEMLKQGRSEPDSLVVSRFERLCAFLAGQTGRMTVSTMSQTPTIQDGPPYPPLAGASLPATLRRHGEQAVRRLFG